MTVPGRVRPDVATSAATGIGWGTGGAVTSTARSAATVMVQPLVSAGCSSPPTAYASTCGNRRAPGRRAAVPGEGTVTCDDHRDPRGTRGGSRAGEGADGEGRAS